VVAARIGQGVRGQGSGISGQTESRHVRLSIYDITGRLVETLVDKDQEPGFYQVEWDGKNQGSGIYFYRLQISQTPLDKGGKGDFIETKKLVLLH